MEECRAILARGSRVFSRAATVLPPAHRAGVTMLYAWARHCDDLIDHQDHGHPKTGPEPQSTPADRLAALRRATHDGIDGRSGLAAPFVAIGRVVRDHGVGPEDPFVFLDGMQMDVEGRRYPTLESLEVYCYHVAGILAQMATRVIGVEAGEALALVAGYGTAFQLTNIARDVIADADSGRCYLPQAMVDGSGVPAEQLTEPRYRAALAQVVARLLDRADELYRADRQALSSVSLRSAWAILAGRAMYAALATRIRRLGPRAWDRRPSVPAWQRLSSVGHGLWHAVTR